MQKKVIPFALAAMAMLLLAGCGGVEAVINTDLTTFDVVGMDYYEEYSSVYGGSLVAEGEENRILVVTMTAQTEFDETSFKSYFCADNGSSVARVYVDELDSYDCIAVAYQEGSTEDEIYYALAFQVPAAVQKAKLITLEAPNYPQVALKGKLPEGYLETAPIRTASPSESPDEYEDPYATDDMLDETPTGDGTEDGSEGGESEPQETIPEDSPTEE